MCSTHSPFGEKDSYCYARRVGAIQDTWVEWGVKTPIEPHHVVCGFSETQDSGGELLGILREEIRGGKVPPTISTIATVVFCVLYWVQIYVKSHLFFFKKGSKAKRKKESVWQHLSWRVGREKNSPGRVIRRCQKCKRKEEYLQTRKLRNGTFQEAESDWRLGNIIGRSEKRRTEEWPQRLLTLWSWQEQAQGSVKANPKW